MPQKKTGKTIFDGDLKKDEEVVGEKDEFLESEEHAGSHEEQKIKLHTGEKETDVYTKEGREDLQEEEGEIANWEEGFAEGAAGKGGRTNCAQCKAVLTQQHDVVEREIDGTLTWFCSGPCVDKFVEAKGASE